MQTSYQVPEDDVSTPSARRFDITNRVHRLSPALPAAVSVATLGLLLPGLAWAQGAPVDGGLRDWVNASLHAAAGIVGLLAVLIMLWGVARIFWRFVGAGFFRGRTIERNNLRSELGYYILLGLELLIVADVIETITAPDLEHVLVLGLIVFIRTVIAFSLYWELAQEAKHGRWKDT